MSVGSSVKKTQPPTAKEIQTAARVLSKLEPGFLPRPIFEQVTRLNVTPIIELVPLRKGANYIEVLLLKRADDDPSWPGMLHTPGTVLRSTDIKSGIEGALERIFTEELGVSPISHPIFYDTVFHKVKRGSELASVYYVDMDSAEVAAGQWYRVDNLPDSIVDTQIKFIKTCARDFLERNDK